MTIEKDKSIKVDSRGTVIESQGMRDQQSQLLFERACQLIRDQDMLSQAIQADFFKTTPIPECTPECTFEQSNQLAEFIIADDAEMVGRLVIDRIINVTWAMAERELGLTISENPDTPSIKKENTH